MVHGYAQQLEKIHKRILIVDDDEAILDVRAQYMKIIGLDAVGASSGEDALSLAFQKDHLISSYRISKWPTWMDFNLLGEVKRIIRRFFFSSLQATPQFKPFWRP